MLSRAEVGEKLRIVSNLDLSPSLERVKAAAEIMDTDAALRAELEGLKTGKDLIDVLSNHCGESGVSEGAVETLERIIKERADLTAQLEAMQKALDTAILLEREQCACAIEWQAGAVSGFEREELIRMACKIRTGQHGKMIALPDYKDLSNRLEQQLAAMTQERDALQRANNPYCLICGKTEPCTMEVDLKPGDPGVPCTFDYTPRQMLDVATQYKRQLVATKAHLAMVESGQAREDEIQILHDKIASWENLDDQYHALQQQLTASISKNEHNRIVADTIKSLDIERTQFEKSIAASEARVQREIKRGDLYKIAGEQAQTHADTLQARVTALEEALKTVLEKLIPHLDDQARGELLARTREST